MSLIQFKNLNGKPVQAEVISVAGQVIDINRSNQTHLHASGGGAYASSSNGRSSASVSPISVKSTNSVHDDVYILTETGEEVFLQLVNWENAGIRKGHFIEAIWLKVDNGISTFSTPYVVINNRSLNKVLYDNNQLLELVKPTDIKQSFVTFISILSPMAKIVCGIILAACILMLISTPLMIIVLLPVLAGLLAFIAKNAIKQLAPLMEKEVKPRLHPLLLPPITKQM